MAFYCLLNLIIPFFFVPLNLPTITNNPSLVSLNPGVKPLIVKAERSAVLSGNDRVFLWSSHGSETQPIASITKLMTALVFLDYNPGWETVYKVTADDHVEGGRLNLFLGDQVTVKNLFYTSLVASDNGATLALVHATGLSENDFVSKMNQKARVLGLSQTHFDDPIGLSANNVSTAEEVAKLAKAALSRTEIAKATEQESYEFKTLDDKNIKVDSTDYLLFDPAQNSFQVLGGKTGYTDQAGYCFVGRFQDKEGRMVISVVLNAGGKNERFLETKNLVNWIFNSYNW